MRSAFGVASFFSDLFHLRLVGRAPAVEAAVAAQAEAADFQAAQGLLQRSP